MSLLLSPYQCVAAEVATDQRQVAIGYDRLETLALRIADAVEETDAARADQIRTAIGEARSLGIGERFDKVVGLLEQQRYASARQDQTELATQLEELLRIVMADPNAARLEEERRDPAVREVAHHRQYHDRPERDAEGDQGGDVDGGEEPRARHVISPRRCRRR